MTERLGSQYITRKKYISLQTICLISYTFYCHVCVYRRILIYETVHDEIWMFGNIYSFKIISFFSVISILHFSHRDHDLKTIAATSFIMLPPQNTDENETQNDTASPEAEGLPVYSLTSDVNVTPWEERATSRRSANETSGATLCPSEPPPSYQECILSQMWFTSFFFPLKNNRKWPDCSWFNSSNAHKGSFLHIQNRQYRIQRQRIRPWSCQTCLKYPSSHRVPHGPNVWVRY